MTLIVKTGFNGMTDADAIAYVNAVEAADGQLLEFGVGKAINDFVVGCKLDNTWSAIKASCILAGARTLTGALVPLVGTAPTNFNFVSGDYNRKTGLVGDGSTKYLDSNRNNNADPQDSSHNAVFVSAANSTGATGVYIGTSDTAGANNIGQTTTALFVRNRTFAGDVLTSIPVNFIGTNRANSSTFTRRASNVDFSVSLASNGLANQSILVFTRVLASYTNARLAFYSIGESLDLALLDARVTTLINAFAAAIP
jgi:hypothetical protein